MATPWPLDDRQTLIADRAFVFLCSLLFIYSLLRWQGQTGADPSQHSVHLVIFTAALVLLGLAGLAKRHSRRAFYVLLVAAFAILALGTQAR